MSASQYFTQTEIKGLPCLIRISSRQDFSSGVVQPKMYYRP